MSDMASDMLEEYVGKTEALESKVKELEALVTSLRQQLKTARETIDSYQKRAVSRRRDEYDYLDYEEDRDR